MIIIENMQPIGSEAEAKFDATFPDGWLIRRCIIVRRPDGELAALPPLIGAGIRAVKIPQQHWRGFIVAALDAFHEFERDRDADATKDAA